MSMSKGFEVAGVKSAEKAASYVYTLSADSGYTENETGRISADRHGLVCRALAGKLDDYDQLAEQRAELLEALQRIAEYADGVSTPVRNSVKKSAIARAAIANATQQLNATGGEG